MSYQKKKRYRIRYDRIVGVAAVFIVLIILLVSCCKSCGNDDEKINESSIVPTSDKSQDSENSSGDSSSQDGSSENEQPGDTSDMEYTTISAMPNEIYTGDLVLVNKQHAYSFPASAEDSDIVPVYEYASGSYQFADYETSLSKKTITALNSLMDAFYSETGRTGILVRSGYRTKEEQDELTDTDIKGGYSDLHTGLSFTLNIVTEDSSWYYLPEDEYAWINDNCANYGFILRYPEGKDDKTGVEAKTDHFRYVGVPHAIYMKENNLCLEEYIAELKNHPKDGEHIKVSGSEKKYEIYYVPADPSANTDIPVPADKPYTVSGNNVDGFIVTVEK